MPVRVDNPILLLRQEHDQALAVLDRLAAALHDLTVPGAVAEIERAIAFLDAEVRAHNEREEQSLFPILERYITPSGPTAVMRSEHREFWNLLSALKSTLRESPPSPNLTLARGLAAVDLLRRHIQKENGVLFPMAQQLLTPEEMSHVARTMEELIGARESAPAALSG